MVAMQRRSPQDADPDDDDDGWDEGPGAWEEDEETETVECPKCGADLYEDAVRCPLCGEYVHHTHSVWKDKPLWWKLVGLAGILAILLSIAISLGF
jgi:hypothetical protein